MTREDAVKIVWKITKGEFVHGARLVECLEALGMLKLEEPEENVERRFKRIYASWPIGWTPDHCLESLKKHGLKIVEK